MKEQAFVPRKRESPAGSASLGG